METKDKWPKAGDKMKFLGRNGYDDELAVALKVLEVGQVLTVQKISVGYWSHSIRFEEVEGAFNGVMFEWLQDLPVAESEVETKWYREVVWVTETSPNPGYTSLSGLMPTGKPHYAFADVVTKMTGEDGGCNEEVLELLRAAPEVATQRDELLEALKRIERATVSQYLTHADMAITLQSIASNAIARDTGASS